MIIKENNEILNFIKKKRKTLTKTTKSGYKWQKSLHVTVWYVEDVEAWQIGLHHIEGDVVMTLSEFWVNEEWQPIVVKDKPPTMWYFPEYIDKVVEEQTSYKSNKPITF